ncbi:hypothetical protein BT96DRAFT_920638 [Gymnopus androsaceus JB14]|uniref:DUF6533 domain-containing protein n=1 Tax=Gymnopus androsaceus JB14 TaxID=1447944 RepID=A0A6A4HNZ5_9AGAR|nr:hypothetical protein BT96DRAFT_920638 [Gymnopus androsaceus JB14]
MSNDAEDPNSIAYQLLLHSYFEMLAITILYWDHLLTLKYEIQYLWQRPMSWSSYWFFLNRYFAFFSNITVTILGYVNLSTSKYGLYRQITLVIQQVIVCVLLTMRIHALYGRSVRILSYMLGSGAILAGVAVWSLFGQKSSTATSGCHIALEFTSDLATAWEALFCYDSILFGLTLYQTHKSRRSIPGMGPLRIPLISLMLRDVAAQRGIFSVVPTFRLEEESWSTGVELDTLRTEDLTHGLTTRYTLT